MVTAIGFWMRMVWGGVTTVMGSPLLLGVEGIVLVVERTSPSPERKVCSALLALLGWATVCFSSWVR